MAKLRDVLQFADQGRLKLELLSDVRAAILPVYEAAHNRIRKLVDQFVSRYQVELDDDERVVDSPATRRAIRFAESDVRRLLTAAGDVVVRQVIPFMRRSAEQIALDHLRDYSDRFWGGASVSIPQSARQWLERVVRDIESWHIDRIASRITDALHRARSLGELVTAIQDELVAIRGEKRVARMYAEAIGQFFAQALTEFGKQVRAKLYLHVGIIDDRNVEDITRANPPGLIHPAFAGPNPRKGGRPGYGSRDFIGRIFTPEYWELIHPDWQKGRLHYGERGLFYPVPAEGDIYRKHLRDVAWLEQLLNRWAARTGQPLVSLQPAAPGGGPRYRVTGPPLALPGPRRALALPPPSGPPPRPPAPAGAPEFPDDPTNLRVVRTLPGSTSPQLVEDQWGRKYVLKRGGDHVREEYYAEEVYRAMGIRVPPSRLYTQPDGSVVKLSVYIEPQPGGSVDTLAGIWNQLSKGEQKRVLREIRKGFAVDAWLANWDVIGLARDNILVRVGPGRKGRRKIEVYRIDAGGALRYRAQGAPKGDQFGEQVMELWTLRDQNTNPQAASVFGQISVWEIPKLARRVNPRKLTGLPLPADLKARLRARARNMAATVRVIRDFERDSLNWTESYVDSVSKHYMRATAVRQPTRLKIGPDGKARTPSGKSYHEEMIHQYKDYFGAIHPEAYRLPILIAKSHGIHSDVDQSVAARSILRQHLQLSVDEVFWSARGQEVLDRIPDPRQFLADEAGIPAEYVDDVLAAQHAWSIRNLDSKSIPAAEVRRRDRRIAVVRTWSISVLHSAREVRGPAGDVHPAHDLAPGDSVLLQKHAVYDSTSVRHTTVVYGGEAVVYRVPFVRFWMPYWIGSDADEWTSFLAPVENEALCFLNGARGVYAGSVESRTTVRQLVRIVREAGADL